MLKPLENTNRRISTLLKTVVLLVIVFLNSNSAQAQVVPLTISTSCTNVNFDGTSYFDGTGGGCTGAGTILVNTSGPVCGSNTGTGAKVGWIQIQTSAATTYTLTATTATAGANLQLEVFDAGAAPGTCPGSAGVCIDANSTAPTLQVPQTEQAVINGNGDYFYVRIINGSNTNFYVGLCLDVSGANLQGTCSNPYPLSSDCDPAPPDVANETFTTGHNPTCSPVAGNYFKSEYWYSYTIAAGQANQILSVQLTTGSDGSAVVQLFSGTCGSLTQLICNNAGGSTTAGQVVTVTSASALAPGTYLIRILDYAGATNVNTNFALTGNRVCVNTTCVAANTLTSGSCSGSYPIADVSQLTTVAVPTVTCGGISDGPGVSSDAWFTYTATSTSPFTITATTGPASGDMVIQVLSGTCGTSFSQVGTCININNTPGVQTEPVVVATPTNNTTYYIRVVSTNTGGSDNISSICINSTPANDNCSGAVSITPNAPAITCSSPTAGTTLGASQSSASTSCSFGLAPYTTNDDVWYSFVASTVTNPDSIYKITVTPVGLFDPVIELFNGSCAGASMGCYDVSGAGTAEVANLSHLANGTYYFRIYDAGSGVPVSSAFSVCITSPPVNDNCWHAKVLNPGDCSSPTPGSVNLATSSGIATSSIGGCTSTTPNDDVWYYFQATGSSHTVTVTGSGIAPTFEVFNAASPGTSITCLGSSIVCNSSSTIGATISSAFATTSGNYYYVRVYNYGGSATATTGLFTICILSPPPANDNCSGAISLTNTSAGYPAAPPATCALLGSGGNQTTGTISFATQSLPPNSSCGASSAATDVWYSFVASATTHVVTVIPIAASFDAVFEVYSTACGANSIGCTNAYGTGVTESATLNGLSIGATYWVRVYDAGATAPATTNFDICVTTPPANDEPCNAVSLTSYPSTSLTYTTNQTVNGGTQTLGTATCGGSPVNDVWYSFTAVQTQETVTLQGIGTFTTYYAQLFSGTCTSPGTLTSLSPGCTSTSTAGSAVTIVNTGLTIGTTYFVRVYGVATSSSTFNIAITHNLNDQCTQAVTVTCGNSYSGTTTSATTTNDATGSCNGAVSRPGVWYMFVPTATASVTVNTCTSSMTNGINIYTGTCNATPTVPNTCVANTATTCGNGQSVTFTATSGTTYWIFVYNTSATSGTFTLSLSCGALLYNDQCTGASQLFCGSSISETTVGATSTNDPTGTCGTSITSPGVWYYFVGTGATVTADLCTSTAFDTKLTVYTGTCNSTPTVPATCVTGNNNTTGCGSGAYAGLGSSVTFASVSGTTYYLFVSGNNTNTGTFTLTITCVGGPPVNDQCAGAIPVVCGNTYSGSTVYATSTNDYTGTQGLASYSGACGFTSSSPYWYSYTHNTTPGVWYVYHSTTATTITATTLSTGSCYTNYDNILYVYSGTCSSMTCVSGNDDYCAVAGGGQVKFTTAACTDYYILVSGYSGSVGTFNLKITGSNCTPTPGNDQCTSATVIPACGTTGITGTTVGATTLNDPTTSCGGVPITAPGVWYVYSSTDTLLLQATLCNTTINSCYPTYNNIINVYTGSCPSLTCVNGNDNYCGINGQVTFLSHVGNNNYYIFVQGESNTVGPFTLDFNGLPVTSGTPVTLTTGTVTPTVTLTACKPLPIELVYFTGQSEGKRNLLKWETASEVNNDYFTLEKSMDAITFNQLSRINGAGNSTHYIDYSAYDNSPYNDITYYRLKQTDYNGAYAYSSIVAVANKLYDLSLNNVRPNPTTNDVNFDLFSPGKGIITIQLLDFFGQVVFNEVKEVEQGNSVNTVRMADLPQGVYTLKVTSNQSGMVSVTKVVKN